MFDLKKLLNSTQLALLRTFGLTTKYCAHIGFDSEFYLETYPDVAQAQVDPLGHYIRCGRAEGRIGKFEFCGERGGQQFDLSLIHI